MASSKRERELARARAERQAQRRAEMARRKRRRTLLTSGVVATVLAVGGVGLAVGLGGGGSKAGPAALPTPSTTPTGPAVPTVSPTPAAERPLACGLKAPLTVAKQTFPKEPPVTVVAAKTYTMSITTSCGPITATLDATKAPHTVSSFAFLAGKHFFDGDECHRVTTSPGLTVLQCGDPTASGSGGPGYSFVDENLTGATYPRGTLAMANSGKDTNGSQFFLVDKDSQLPPSYTVFGRITKGLDVLDGIVAKGVAGGGTDGKPAERVFLKTLTVTAA